MDVIGVIHPVLLAWKEEAAVAAHHTGVPGAPGAPSWGKAQTHPAQGPKQSLTFQISKPPVLLQDREQLGETLGVPQGLPVLGQQLQPEGTSVSQEVQLIEEG